jgi:hypothetical protein
VTILRSRRLWLLLLLPLTVAAIWLAIAFVAERQRSALVDRLTMQLIEGNRQGSLAAIRALASDPRPLLEPIVRAATSPNRTLAEGAQLAVSDLVEQWERQLDSVQNPRPVADGLSELAASLDANGDAFARQDGPWIARTVSAILRLANRVSPSDGLELTTHCESLLAVAARGHLAAAKVSSPPPLPLDGAAAPIRAKAESAAGDSQPRPSTSAIRVEDITPIVSSGELSDAERAFSAPPQTAYQAITPSDATNSNRTDPDHVEAPQLTDSQTRWTWPANGNTGTADVGENGDSHTAASSPQPTAISTNAMAEASDMLKSASSRDLLQRWLSASEASRPPLEGELTRRGLGTPNVGVVRMLLSDRVGDRVNLVRDVMSAPGINTKAWLQLFAEDPDADIRLAAITLMSTSNDASVVDQAYQATLHDRDPRVADLASRLRDRRDNIQRR